MASIGMRSQGIGMRSQGIGMRSQARVLVRTRRQPEAARVSEAVRGGTWKRPHHIHSDPVEIAVSMPLSDMHGSDVCARLTWQSPQAQPRRRGEGLTSGSAVCGLQLPLWLSTLA